MNRRNRILRQAQDERDLVCINYFGKALSLREPV